MNKRQVILLLSLFLSGILVVVFVLWLSGRVSGGASTSGFPVQLNEVMSSNSAYYDPSGNAYDWIELYNSSQSDINLSNYKLTDNERKVRYIFPAGSVIPAQGYFLVWCKSNTTDAQYADFSISKAGGEAIVLMNSRSVIIDRLVTEPMDRNNAMARDINGTWQISSQATPGFENTDAGYAAYLLAHQSSQNPVKINEVMSSNQSYLDENQRSSDWIELYNASSEPVDLSGMRLSDRADSEGYLFAAGSILNAGEYLVVRCDGGASDAAYAPFSLLSGGGETISLSNGDLILDSITTPALVTDTSYARGEDGVWQGCDAPTPGYPNTTEGRAQYLASVGSEQPSLQITELMAENLSCLQDTDGDFSDWLELSNSGDTTVYLGGYFLSDESGKPLKWALPQMDLPAGGRLVVFASGKDHADADQPHTNFSLNRRKGILTLSNAAGQVLSSVSYAALEGNVSYVLDEASGLWSETEHATPGYSNDDAGYAAFQEAKTSASPLLLNEAMPGNDSLLEQSMGSYYDWVELKNQSKQEINLSGYSLTDDLENGTPCPLPNQILAPGKVIVLLCTGSEPLAKPEYAQIALSLDSARDTLFLLDSSGAVADLLTLSEIPYGASCGRMPGQNGQFYFSVPTPDKANRNGFRLVSAKPSSAEASGIYNNVSSLSVSLSGEGTIFYTTDGSVPTTRSKKYSEPITLKRTAVIRVAAKADGRMISPPLTLHYFLNENHTLPIISVVTNEDNIEGPDGILATANLFDRTVERPASVAFFSDEGSFAADCGFKLHGAGSRGRLRKKSFKVVFRQRYGLAQLDFPLFADNDITAFDSFLIRNSQDFSRTMIRDELLTQIARSGTTELMVQDTRFCVFYLNGNYQGVYCIKEAFSSGYFARKFGVSAESVELQRGYLTPDCEMQQLIDYAQGHDLRQETYYRYVEDRVNFESLIDWSIYEAYAANSDLAVNVRYYRSKEYDNNRWHYALFDLDYGFGGPATFTFILGSPHGKLLEALLKNDSFRDLFLKRLAYQLENNLTDENVMASYLTLTDQIKDEVARERALWTANDTFGWENHLKTLRQYMSSGRIAQLKWSIADALRIPLSDVEQYFQGANG